MDYEALLEDITPLFSNNLIRYVELRVNPSDYPSLWEDILEKKYTIKLKGATKEDYIVLSDYLAHKKGEDIRDDIRIEFYNFINEKLYEIEVESEEEPKLWTACRNEYMEYNYLKGVYCTAKTLAGAIFKMGDYSIEAIPLHSGYIYVTQHLFQEKDDRIESILLARDRYNLLLLLKKILPRLETPSELLPSLDEIEVLLKKYKKEGYINKEDDFIKFFTLLFVDEGDDGRGFECLPFTKFLD